MENAIKPGDFFYSTTAQDKDHAQVCAELNAALASFLAAGAKFRDGVKSAMFYCSKYKCRNDRETHVNMFLSTVKDNKESFDKPVNCGLVCWSEHGLEVKPTLDDEIRCGENTRNLTFEDLHDPAGIEVRASQRHNTIPEGCVDAGDGTYLDLTDY